LSTTQYISFNHSSIEYILFQPIEKFVLTAGTAQNLIKNIGHNHGVFSGLKIGDFISQHAHFSIHDAF
jgi:hypothetical protein